MKATYRCTMVTVPMLVLVLHPPIGVKWLTLQSWYSCYIRLSVRNGWSCNVGTRATSDYRCAMVDVAMLLLVLHPPICVQWLTLQSWYSCYIRLSVCHGWRCNVGTRPTSAYLCAMVDVAMLVFVLHPPIGVQWLTFQSWYSCYIRLSVCNSCRSNVGTCATSAYQCAIVDVPMLVLVLHPCIGVQWLTLQCWYSCYIRPSVCNALRCNVGTRVTSPYQCAMFAVPMLVLVLHRPVGVQ